jgi:hypothetical protein
VEEGGEEEAVAHADSQRGKEHTSVVVWGVIGTWGYGGGVATFRRSHTGSS